MSAAAATGTVASVTVWPVKSMGGGTPLERVAARPAGLAGDREFALLDRRPLRDGKVLSARNLPGILRWAAAWTGGPTPVVSGPDGAQHRWDERLRDALRDDLGAPVDLAGPGSFADLADSVLVTTSATHAAVEQAFGRPLDGRRWRTNLHLDLSAAAHAERLWEGGTLAVGDPDRGGVRLRLLHPCRRCTIPTWEPGGRTRQPELLRWFHTQADGVFGINARVVSSGELRVGDRVEVHPAR